MKKIWGGRFREEVDRRVMDFTGSFGFDARLLPYDIKGSIAHARMLARTGLLTPGEGERIAAALEELLAECRDRAFSPEEAEDVHSFVETRLAGKIGDLAGKLHTARSRNDQVALDMKLFLLDQAEAAAGALKHLMGTILGRAEENLDTVMPGYTHLQPAQPVLLAHHLLAYFEMFLRDLGRFADAARRAGLSPLGAGALAGTSLPIDRESTARELGFRGPTRNSLDSVSERDFPLEFSAAACQTMLHLSRLAEEIVLWSSPAYGFIRLPDRLATGSSMMPQKKNPDVAELVRGKCGRVLGHFVALAMVLKGLPLAYQRDLQEDKEAVFDTVDTLLACLGAMDLYLSGAQFQKERMAAEAGREHATATDLAERLVLKGVPFRRAHELVGAAVSEAAASGRNLDQLTPEEIVRLTGLEAGEAGEVLTAPGSVGHKQSFGSTSPGRVAEAVREARKILAGEEGRP